MQNYYTENLAEFGVRERKIAGAMLVADLPEHFDTVGVRIAFNKNSGNVFLVNDDYQVAMFNGTELALFHNTPYEGFEGFIEDLLEISPENMHHEDATYILEWAQRENVDLPVDWVEVYLALEQI